MDKNLKVMSGVGILIGIVFIPFANFFVVKWNQEIKIIFDVSCILAGIFVANACYFLSKSFTKSQIENINSVLSDIGEGDFTKRVELDNNKDFQILEKNINLTIEKMIFILSNLNNHSIELKNKAEQLINKSYKGEKIIDTLENENSNIKTIIDENESDLCDGSGIVKEIAEIASKSSSKIYDFSSTVNESCESVNQIKNFTSDTVELMNKMIETSKFINNNIIKTFDKMKGINKALLHIKQISRQINLLSINASIEASSNSGNQNGFKVLVTEMKKLADSSRLITDKIEIDINEIIDYNKAIENRLSTNESGLDILFSASNEMCGKMQILSKDSCDIGDGISYYSQVIEEISELNKMIDVMFKEISEKQNNLSVNFNNIEKVFCQKKDNFKDLIVLSEYNNNVSKNIDQFIQQFKY